MVFSRLPSEQARLRWTEEGSGQDEKGGGRRELEGGRPKEGDKSPGGVPDRWGRGRAGVRMGGVAEAGQPSLWMSLSRAQAQAFVTPIPGWPQTPG